MAKQKKKKRHGQSPSIKKNIAGRHLRDTLTRILPDRTYLTKKYFLLDAKDSFNNLCAYCNKKLPLTRKHVISNLEGGTMELANIIPVCQPCNDEKRETPWREFAILKCSQFIENIESRIQGYVPLNLEELHKSPDEKVREAFKKYDEKIQQIETMSKKKQSA